VNPPVDRWQDILQPQAADLVLLAIFLTLALVSFVRKSVPLKYAALVFAVAYMGFYKSHLISIVDVFGVVEWNLPIAKYNISYYAFGLFVIGSTILWGRFYCGRVCAFGAMTQLMDAVLPARLRIEPPPAIERRAAWIKYGLLAGVVVYFLVTRDLLVYRYVEPFWMFGLFGTTAMWVGLGVLLAATVFVRNLYCRFLCPVGALLGLMSSLTIFRIKRWPECRSCRICEKKCEWGAIRGPQIVKSECVRCDDCERLYLDQNKCPHWIILLKARPSGGPSAPAARPGPASSARHSSP
jgi:polyferredoxin